MELSLVLSRAVAGVEAPLVQVETHLSNGLPAFHIVGLPETTVRESKDRVRCAIINSHFQFPDRRITVNLAPADLPKEGGRLDLPIALGILAASCQLPARQLAQHVFMGELSLDGSLRPVPGVIPAAWACTSAQRCLTLPVGSAALAARVPSSRIIACEDLLTLCAHLNGAQPIAPAAIGITTEPTGKPYPDLVDILGQAAARRALEIAASGGHNLLLFGPPGTGKTLLASRLPGILPPPTPQEALTGLALRNAYDGSCDSQFSQRPFRNPHHTATAAALSGGGSKPRPGEISLAHGGVLFLDELPEFSRHSLEVLREPMDSGQITLSRARHKTTYPASFQLVAAMNPCPCGYLGDPERACRCTPQQIQRYRARISGPLLDRIDLHVPVNRVPAEQLLAATCDGERSATVRARVCQSRERQMQRQDCANANLPANQLPSICALGQDETRHLQSAISKLQLSARALHRTLRVARTLADLEGSRPIRTAHLNEALGYRAMDDAH
jgi:magnesium chelatase family protein